MNHTVQLVGMNNSVQFLVLCIERACRLYNLKIKCQLNEYLYHVFTR